MLFNEANKPEILLHKNIVLNCREEKKEQVIKNIGKLLVDSGYVVHSYIDAMIEREEAFATYMGNGIALPHGVESAKADIISSGMAIMVFPEGTDWDGERAYIVVGIAGKGEEHLDILSNIACKMDTIEAMKSILSMNVDEVFEFFTRKD